MKAELPPLPAMATRDGGRLNDYGHLLVSLWQHSGRPGAPSVNVSTRAGEWLKVADSRLARMSAADVVKVLAWYRPLTYIAYGRETSESFLARWYLRAFSQLKPSDRITELRVLEWLAGSDVREGVPAKIRAWEVEMMGRVAAEAGRPVEAGMLAERALGALITCNADCCSADEELMLRPFLSFYTDGGMPSGVEELEALLQLSHAMRREFPDEVGIEEYRAIVGRLATHPDAGELKRRAYELDLRGLEVL